MGKILKRKPVLEPEGLEPSSKPSIKNKRGVGGNRTSDIIKLKNSLSGLDGTRTRDSIKDKSLIESRVPDELDSNVPFKLSMPEHWLPVKLKDIAVWGSGGTPKSSEKKYYDGNIPWLIIGDLNDTYVNRSAKTITEDGLKNSSAKLVSKGAILIAMYGSIGKLGIAGIECATNQAIAFTQKINDEVNNKFLFYYLLSIRKELLDLGKGGTQQNISQTVLKEVPFPLPPLPEQERIVAKLDALMAKVEANKERLEKIPQILKRFRQSVLTAAVSGKLTEEWRGKLNEKHENKTHLVELLKKTRFHNYLDIGEKQKSLNKSVPKLPEFKLLENEQIPTSWLSVTLESATTFIIDCQHSTPKFTDSGNYCIDTTCIAPFKILFSSARRITQDSFIERTSRMTPETGDVLFSREGTIGTAVLYNGEHPICLGQRMMMFRFADFVLPKFAELYLASNYFRNLYSPFISGTSAQHVNIGDLRQLEFLLPTKAEQKEIIHQVEMLFAFAENLESHFKKAKCKFKL